MRPPERPAAGSNCLIDKESWFASTSYGTTERYAKRREGRWRPSPSPILSALKGSGAKPTLLQSSSWCARYTCMRYVCIHGHFYQPPRENPWLDTIEVQDSAAPYHDWNARITAECYWPNAAARLLGPKDRIAAIVNNYASLSFNFGPTLTAWFARCEPELLTQIIAADRLSQAQHDAGHGNAIAQAYGHA